ncbi:MAG: hypothetical protein HY860_00310 [Chlamydiales bacterium]|nr:hypothetical protein [Chlamydiales bacterium]
MNRGHFEIVGVLLANGPIYKEDRGRAVHLGVIWGDLDIIKELLIHGPITDEGRDLVVEAIIGRRQKLQDIADFLTEKTA